MRYLSHKELPPLIDDYAAIAPRISGGLSFVSSCIVIYLIARSQDKLHKIYHRIMFGMCIADMIGSFVVSLTTLPMPRDLSLVNSDVAAYIDEWKGTRLGNWATCTAQGFFSEFGLTAMYAYNGALCIYYACVIFFKMKEKTIVKYEPLIHLVPFSLALAAAIIPLSYNSYSATGYESWCTSFSPYLLGSLVLLEWLLCAICFLLIISKVIITDRRLNNVMISRQNDNDELEAGDSRNESNQSLEKAKKANSNSKVVIVQALGYFLSFILTLSALVIKSFLDHDTPYWVERLGVFLVPLQGFFNAIIFICHKVYNYRRIHPDVSRYEVIKKLFKGDANDDILFTRISNICIDERNHVMEVEVENERHDNEHLMIDLSQSSHYLSGFSSNSKPESITSSSYPEMGNELKNDKKRETGSTDSCTFDPKKLSSFRFRDQYSDNDPIFDNVSSIDFTTEDSKPYHRKPLYEREKRKMGCPTR